jgi:putative ATPase
VHSPAWWDVNLARKSSVNLFREVQQANLRKAQPLAARMRPRTVDEFIGQDHFFGPEKLLRRMLQADRISSLIFYGPPGTGKTALAHVIAQHTQCQFRQLNAVAAGIKEVRELLDEARKELEDSGRRTILFVDELHRFNRAQQDVLLPDVEEGRVTLIGATTQNPFFAINSPLLSRSQIFTFETLSREHIKTLVQRALADRERGLGETPVNMHADALEFLAEMSDGDARRALTALEIGVLSSQQRPVEFTLEVAQDSIQRKVLDYDPTGDAHYDLASAFIKSMRGSDPDAAIYWLARMLEAGEDPRFIARRMIICGGGGVAGDGVCRPPRVPVAARPGGHVHCQRTEVECVDHGDHQGTRRCQGRPDVGGAGASARRQLLRRQKAGARDWLRVQP